MIEDVGHIRSFPAKILLLGEYCAIHGAEAIALPSKKYKAYWDINPDLNIENHPLYRFFTFLQTQKSLPLQFKKWESDLHNGHYLHSNIPSSYGLGSSGSLVAAIFDRYNDTLNQNNLSELRKIFIVMENYFHSKSSGIDPLVAYLHRALLVNKQIEVFDHEDMEILDRLYLWDSGIKRNTLKFVQWYQARLKNSTFENTIHSRLIPANTKARKALFETNLLEWENAWKEIVDIQSHSFDFMIPESVKNIWTQTNALDGLKMKICGAGGGGFFLVYARSQDLIPSFLNPKIQKIL